MHIKLLLCPNPQTGCLQINSLCQIKTATKKVSTAKPGLILKIETERANCHRVHRKLQLRKKTHFALRYEIKTATKKNYEPTAGEKSKGFNNCPAPQQQKTKQLKAEKK